jgi:hypothetical protein
MRTGITEMKLRPALCSALDVFLGLAVVAVLIHARSEFVHANPYLAKAGDPPLKARVGTCALTGAFIHLYAALDSRVFNKYGISAEHVVLRGGVVASPNRKTNPRFLKVWPRDFVWTRWNKP